MGHLEPSKNEAHSRVEKVGTYEDSFTDACLMLVDFVLPLVAHFFTEAAKLLLLDLTWYNKNY